MTMGHRDAIWHTVRRSVGRMGRLAAAVAALGTATWALWHLLQAPPAPRCRLPIAIAVPALEALPVRLVGSLSQPGGRSCRLELGTPSALAHDPLAVLPGTAWLTPGAEDRRIGLALVAERVDSALLERGRNTGPFLWHDLAGRVVLLPQATGDLGPMLVQAILAAHRVSGALLLKGLGLPAFRRGDGTYIALPLPQAITLATRGEGRIATLIGLQTGPVPAAVLAAQPHYLSTHRLLVDALVRAVFVESARLDAHPGRATASGAVLAADRAAVREASRIHLWATDPRLDTALFTRLAALMAVAGVPSRPLRPHAFLDGPAERALRQGPAFPSSGSAAVRHE